MFFCNNKVRQITWIHKTFNPFGFYDLLETNCTEIVQIITKNPVQKFYSRSIVNKIELGNQLQPLDIALLELLAQGVKPMKCHHHLAASKSVVYRRKERLKQLFDIEGKSDTALVAVAIRLGCI